MFSLTLSGAPDSAGGPQVINTLWAALLGVFTHALENIDIQESSGYGRPRMEKLPSAGVRFPRSSFRRFASHLSTPPGVQPRPPAILLMLRMKPELVSFLLPVFCQPMQTPIKPSLTVVPHPPILCFAFFENIFSAVCISIST